MNIKTTDLIARLGARKAEVVADYEQIKQNIRDEIARRGDEANDAEAHALYYDGIAEGLRTGAYVISAAGRLARGTAQSLPEKPGKGHGRNSDSEYRYYTVPQLEDRLTRADTACVDECRPIDEAISLYSLTTSDEVEIDTGNILRLLSERGSRRFY